MGFIAIPAIDIREGRVVRLQQGDYARQTDYAPKPLQLAQDYAQEGAGWLHLVDLDGARLGGYTLAVLLAMITRTTELQVQTGGGIRSLDDVRAVLDVGAARVVIGSLAVREPGQVADWLRRVGPDRLTIALDARKVEGQWRLPLHGWTEESDRSLDELAQFYAQAGLKHLLCTDIDRDGMLAGPNLDLYRHLTALVPGISVQASGGIRNLADIQAARDAGCGGAVLGKALLEHQFTLKDALSC